MTEGSDAVLTLCEHDVPEVVDILCESFFDYPVMQFVVGRDEKDYEVRLRKLIHFFVMARVLRGEVLLGIGDPNGLGGAALVSRPTEAEAPPELSKLSENVWSELGASARARYEAFGAACAPFEVETPHIHLNMIGVRREAQGTGLGRRLIEHVHLSSRQDSMSEGVTLTTEVEANVPLYRHFGYEIVGHTTVAPELRTWGFFRAD